MGIHYDLAVNHSKMKSLDTNKEHKIHLKDFMRWHLSGRRDFSRWKKFILYTKYRMQQLFLYGMNSMKSVLDNIKKKNKVIEYLNSRLIVNLNKLEESKSFR